MAHKIKNLLYAPNIADATITTATIEGLAVEPGAAGTAGTGVTVSRKMRPVEVISLAVSSVDIDIEAANDYGSAKLFTFPNRNLILVGATVDITATADGAVITDVTTVDYALGTVALTSIDFSNSGEKDIIAEGDVAALGVVAAESTASEDLQFIAAAADNEVYFNAQATVGAGTGTVTIDGTVELLVIDLGA